MQNICVLIANKLDFPGGSDGKETTYNAGDPGLITESGRSPGGGNGNPLQYSCLGNSMDREAWRATVHGVTKSWTPLSDDTFTLTVCVTAPGGTLSFLSNTVTFYCFILCRISVLEQTNWHHIAGNSKQRLRNHSRSFWIFLKRKTGSLEVSMGPDFTQNDARWKMSTLKPAPGVLRTLWVCSGKHFETLRSSLEFSRDLGPPP